MLNVFKLNPKIYMDAIRRETTRGNYVSLLGPCGEASPKTVDAFFSHITNFVSQRHSVITRGCQFLEPMAYLNVETIDEQRYLLQPTAAEGWLQQKFLLVIFSRMVLAKMQRRRYHRGALTLCLGMLQAKAGCSTIL